MRDEQQWRNIAQKLTDVLQTNVVPGERGVKPEALREVADKVTFIPTDSETGLWVAGTVSEREERLLAMVIEQQKSKSTTLKKTEPKQLLLDWLHEVEESQQAFNNPPVMDELVLAERVPFYVVLQGKHVFMSEKEVKRVLQSFFDERVWLLPMSGHEYLILPLASLVFEGDEVEEWQDVLWHWAEGLVELFASELGEDVCAVVHPPIETVTALGAAWLDVKQTAALGKKLHSKRYVFATWDMALERLLHVLPQADRQAFLEDIASESHSWWRDPEMRETLEMFFHLNLNVSETARQLFLHRNTLIYRLDKLKQETGRDVRQFEEAMLIRLALLLTADMK